MTGQEKGHISERSSRIAKNTLLLYFRMLLMMFIGLFTSRIVLNSLGETNYGVYNAVGGIVTVFTFITTSISAAISRYLAFSIGEGDDARLKKVFGTSVVVQVFLATVIILLVESAGHWLLERRMNIPPDRMGAAAWVLQCSLGVLVVNLLAVPYNAIIIAHEKMSAFAFISILEAVLKLIVAFLLIRSGGDRLILYSALMVAVAFIVRFSYGIYCKAHFEECRGKLRPDRTVAGEMVGMAGWSFFGSSAYVFNTQGVNIAVNIFFGVVMNTARGLATQVEGIVKQFVSNFLTALNPQITKSWASGDKDYCFELVRKGAKYSFLIILAFMIPLLFETELLLKAWLGDIPEHTAAFVRLTVVGLLVDMFGNPLLTLSLARGKVRTYYLITGLSSYLGLPLVWICFKMGLGAVWAYIVFIAVYSIVLVEKLLIVHRQTGFPIGTFLKDVVLKSFIVSILALTVPLILWLTVKDGIVRLILITIAGCTILALSAYMFAFTDGEKSFILRKIGKYLPDRLYLRMKFTLEMGYRLHLSRPVTFNEKLQWLKIHDRKKEYHSYADKLEAKKLVDKILGPGYTIPTLGVWENACEIDFDSLPDQFVLKCNHDSGSTVICRDKQSLNKDEVCIKLNDALRKSHFKMAREWAYKGIRPVIIAEKFMGDDLSDYKFFCFNGKPEFMFIASDRFNGNEETKFDFFDMDFNHIDVRNGHPNAYPPPQKPKLWEEMINISAKLSEGFKHIRIDLYQIDGKLFFGEFTFYHYGGFVRFEPKVWDNRFGDSIPIRKCSI